MNYLEVLDQVRAHVSISFHSENDSRLLYHNLLHTEHVVQAAVKISNHYKLSDRDFFIVNAAAWFHDTGYLKGFKEHEATGAESAKEFLTAKGVEPAIVESVVNCILATKMPQHPVGLLEQIVCDADLFHLGGENFKEFNKLVRKEAEACLGRELDKKEWRIKTIALLENHHYHTEYCQELLAEGKQRNLAGLKEKAAKEEHRDDHPSARHSIVQGGIHQNEHGEHHQKEDKHNKEHKNHQQEVSKTEEEVVQPKKKKSDRPERGIETMFRTTSGNHQRLSDMADNKAHIMISTNSIILSVILSVLLRKLEDNPHLIIPTLILLIICVVTMVFSILATRPSVPPGTFTAEDIAEKKVNLLFFGNFYKMSLQDYAAGMNLVMEDRDFLYGSLVKDLYFQGVVLGRKYLLLRAAYNVFMFGIVASVLAFVIAAAVVAL
ncbi:Pycsar system effector family protein [Pedobacter sp. AW31-3R]|uniref:Pycsar system effector family protein n=1 Tax=Pedobacter sp. AW31-3R TaxID=3445781 RepID=UPI003F9F2CF3